MKKYFLMIVAFAFLFFGCEKITEPGGTAVDKMAGDWWVTYTTNYYHFMNKYYIYEGEDAPFPGYDLDVNADGVLDVEDFESDEFAEAWEDMFGDGYMLDHTFNTAANVNTEMWLQDAFWSTQNKVNVQYDGKTFSVTDGDDIESGSIVNIIGGKILENAATTPSGMPADSIIFYINYNDDYGDSIWYKVSGFRRTGFAADDF